MRIEGLLINHDGREWGEVEINPETGLIESVGAPTGRADVKFGKEEMVLPGFGDVHIHAREDESGTQNYKEDFTTMSEAAIRGGVAFVADMPNNPVAPINAERYETKKKLAAKSVVDTVFYAAIGPGTSPFEVADPACPGRSRKVPYKVFMGKSVGETFFRTLAELEETLARYRGEAVSFHSENPEIMDRYAEASTHEERRPAEAEASAIEFAIELIKRYELDGKICHVSTAAGAAKIKEAKSAGIKISGEVTLHHLYFDTSMLTPENRGMLQMNPPLRSPADRMALLAALREGTLDYLATDHAPHTLEEKAKGTSGVPHLDTYGPFAAWLMAAQGFSAEQIAEVCAYRPGNFLNPYLSPTPGKGLGRIAPGYAGSLTVLNPTIAIAIRREDLKTKCGWSPFEGVTFPGSVAATIIRGTMYRNGVTP